jgi:hypothetical protein
MSLTSYRPGSRNRREVRVGDTPISPSATKSGIIYAGVAASIIIALSPALFFSFGYHNDFNAWVYNPSQSPQPEFHILIALGRYFGAIAEDLQFLTIHSLGDLWRWRLVAIISTGLLAVYYLHIVSMRRPPTWQNACLTVAVFTLPTMQFQALWVSMYAFWTPPFLLSLAAAHLLLKATGRDILTGRSPSLRFALYVMLAFISLLSGCFFYPLSATFVLVPAAHLLLTTDNKQARLATALSVPILGSAFIALFAVHKFIVLPRLADVPYLGEYAYSFSGHLIAGAFERITIYFENGAYLWLTLQIPHVQTLILVLFVLGAVLFAIRKFRRTIGTSEAVNFLISCFLFVAAAAPLLIVQQFTQTHRVMFTMTGIELLILFWLLNQFPFGSLRLAMLFAALGIGCAFAGVYGTSASNRADYALFSEAVATLSPREFHTITVLRPNSWRLAWGIPLDREFGVLSPSGGIFDLLIGTRYDQQASFDVNEIRVRAGDDVDDALQPAIERDAIVIDTAPIYGLPSVKDGKKRYPSVTAHPGGDLSGPANAVDHDPKTFWEAFGHFPMSLEIEYPRAHTLRGYSLATVEEPLLMPNRWEIWISSDHINWVKVHELTECQPWSTAEIRHYDIKPAANVTGVKLVINGTDARDILRLYEFTPEFTSAPSPNWEADVARDASRLKAETCRNDAVFTKKPTELLDAYKGYNVIRANGLYVGVAQDVGNLNVDNVLANAAPRPPSDKFIVADDSSSLETKIDAYAKDGETSEPPELLYDYKGYNLVRARGLDVAVAQDVGPIDVDRVLTNSVPRPPAEKFFIADDTKSLEAAIDALPPRDKPVEAKSSPRQ